MKVRTLNEDGINEFLNQLQEIKVGDRQSLNIQTLNEKKFSEVFESDIDVDHSEFKNKYEIIKYLCDVLDLKNNKDLYYHRGLWSWLGAFYFDQLTSVKDGRRKVNENAKYVLVEPKNWRRYYRHLLASFARVYCELGDLAMPFLSYPIPIWSDLHEQLLAYQQIATNKPLIAAANKLYWDYSTLKIKKGAGSSGAGTPRRFSAIVGQFELTYDLNAMDFTDILSLFPSREFNKWNDVP